MPCARHSAATGIPPSACRRIARICGSVYLLVFIQNLLMHLAEKILLMQPLTFGRDDRFGRPVQFGTAAYMGQWALPEKR
jgi:hypothetical protein